MNEFRPQPGEVDDILRRGDRMRLQHALMTALGVVLVATTAVLAPNAMDRSALQPANPGVPAASATTASESATPPSASPSGTPATTHSPSPATAPVAGPTAATRPGLRCDEGDNGGATDRGVTATSIDLFTTTSPGGLLAPEAGGFRSVQESLIRRANESGGICGRTLRLRTADDGGDGDTGARLLRAELDRTFAIPYAGATDALETLVRGGDLARTRTPVVGTVLAWSVFHGAGWVWPAGVSDADAARLMVRDAHRRGARTFGVAFEERATGAAFDAEVVRLTGSHAKQFDASACGRQCSDADYVSGTNAFYSNPPDFAGVLLGPAAVAKWMQMRRGPDDLRYGHGTTDWMLDESARGACSDRCHGLRVWSAYKAACGEYADDAAVRRYRADVGASYADETPVAAAVYAAMQRLVAAVRATGPELTRDRLARVLDHTPLTADLTVAGTFAGANDTMREYVLGYAGGTPSCRLGAVGRV